MVLLCCEDLQHLVEVLPYGLMLLLIVSRLVAEISATPTLSKVDLSTSLSSRLYTRPTKISRINLLSTPPKAPEHSRTRNLFNQLVILLVLVLDSQIRLVLFGTLTTTYSGSLVGTYSGETIFKRLLAPVCPLTKCSLGPLGIFLAITSPPRF